MHYVYNSDQNTTVMIALMQNGVIASFEIESNYKKPPPRVKKADQQQNTKSANNETSIVSANQQKNNKTSALGAKSRRDKVEII